MTTVFNPRADRTPTIPFEVFAKLSGKERDIATRLYEELWVVCQYDKVTRVRRIVLCLWVILTLLIIGTWQTLPDSAYDTIKVSVIFTASCLCLLASTLLLRSMEPAYKKFKLHFTELFNSLSADKDWQHVLKIIHQHDPNPRIRTALNALRTAGTGQEISKRINAPHGS